MLARRVAENAVMAAGSKQGTELKNFSFQFLLTNLYQIYERNYLPLEINSLNTKCCLMTSHRALGLRVITVHGASHVDQ